jgi:hypothetical protein
MWADEEETEHRKRHRIELPREVPDHAGTKAAQKFICNAQGVANGLGKLQRVGMSRNTERALVMTLTSAWQLNLWTNHGTWQAQDLELDGWSWSKQARRSAGRVQKGQGTKSKWTASAFRVDRFGERWSCFMACDMLHHGFQTTP